MRRMNFPNVPARVPRGLSSLLLLGLLFTLLAVTPARAAQDELLEPEQAFTFSATALNDKTLRADLGVAPGYYLYRDRIRFELKADGTRLGEYALPAGKAKKDPTFGDVQIYPAPLSLELPLTAPAPGQAVTLIAHVQGCAEVGVCYPPLVLESALTLPGEASANPLAQLKALGEQIDGSQGDGGFLEPEQAFRLGAVYENGTLNLRWTIAPGHYLYRDRVKLGASGLSLSQALIPAGEEKNDPNFGLMRVFHKGLDVSAKVTGAHGLVIVGYQGCSEAGLCYPPMETAFRLDPTKGMVEEVELPESLPELRAVIDMGAEASANASADAKPGAASTAPQSEQDAVASRLASGNTLLTLFWFFVIGLALAFTPCVFPMIPILAGIIAGQGEGLTTRRAFVLSTVYVLAMAITYTVAGVLAGLFGSNIQAAFQNPWILSGFALIFVALAFSMFGFFELQLPSSLQSRMMEISNRQQGGTLTGVAVMGLLSALIVGPCVAPPLAGALIYIGQTGDAWLGGSALFALSMGMGLPLIAVGTLGGKFMPRAGGWMDAVKAVFGVLMLGVAIWMLERVVPENVALLMWALLIIVSAIYMGALEPLRDRASGWMRLWKGLGVVLLLWGALILIGVAAGGGSVLQPLQGLSLGGGSSAGAQKAELHFQKVNSMAELDDALAQAKAAGQPAMLDFYADWCVACKEFEKFTFSDPSVQQALSGVRLLKVDITANSAEHKALLKRYGLFGPPAILFWNAAGEEQQAARVVGFMPAESFRASIERAFGRS